MLKTQCLVTVAVLSAGSIALAQPPQGAKQTPPPAPPAGAPPPAAGGAPPAGAHAAGPPKPAPEFETFMKGFEGGWKCDTKWAAGSMGPGSPEVMVKSTVRFKKDLDGHFYRGDYEVKKSKAMPMNMKGVLYMGYDPASAQLLVSSMDNMGGAAFGTGKIEGDKVTYLSDGYAMGQKVKIREVMGKTGPKEGYHTLEMDMGKGFQPFVEDKCKR